MPAPTRIKQVIDLYARVTGLSYETITGPRGKIALSNLRAEVMVAAYDIRTKDGYRAFSTTQVSRWFNNRHHTGVLYAQKVVERLKEEDSYEFVIKREGYGEEDEAAKELASILAPPGSSGDVQLKERKVGGRPRK